MTQILPGKWVKIRSMRFGIDKHAPIGDQSSATMRFCTAIIGMKQSQNGTLCGVIMTQSYFQSQRPQNCYICAVQFAAAQ